MAEESKKSVKKAAESKPAEKKVKKERSTGKIVGTVVGIVVSVLIIAIVGLGVGVYFAKADGFFGNVAKYLPYPAARVGASAFSVGAYNENVRALTQYFKVYKQTDLNDSANADVQVQIKQSILARMIEDVGLVKVGDELGVSVSQEDIDKEFDNVIKELGDTSEAEKTLDELYGWSIPEFKENVLKPQIRKQKIQKKYMEMEEFTKEERAKANDVLKKVKDGGDFAALAKEFSEDTQSAVEGGDLGETELGMLVPEFEEAAQKLEPGQTSDLVQSAYGFHIIKLESKSEGKIHARHILILTDFNGFIQSKMKEASVNIFVRGFEWDKEEAVVTITDTDGDGVADEQDVDDDNDGSSDTDEQKAGSDPLSKTSNPETATPSTESEESGESSSESDGASGTVEENTTSEESPAE